MTKIVFYDDAPDFGGHEVMMVAVLKYLAHRPDIQVIVFCYAGNLRLLEHMSSIADRIKIVRLPLPSKSFQSQRLWLERRRISATSEAMRAENPDFVVVVQGYIGICSLGLVAAKRVGCPVFSYVAITKSMKKVGARFGAIRDLFEQRLLLMPEAFITISRFMKSTLENRGITSSAISIVNNGVTFCIAGQEESRTARQSLGISMDAFVIGVIGRILFSHKGQDFLLKTIARYSEMFENTRVVIVGEGPDKECLLSFVKRERLDNIVKVLPWMENMSLIYPALDMIAMPSRSEGVPLVMLEALGHGIPVIASRLEELQEFLPIDWQFEFGDSESLLTAIKHIQSGVDQEILEARKDFVKENYSMSNFGERFLSAMMHHYRCLPQTPIHARR